MSGGWFRISEASTVVGCCFSGGVDVTWHLAMRKKHILPPRWPLNLFFSLCLSFKPTQLKQPPNKNSTILPPLPPPNQKKTKKTCTSHFVLQLERQTNCVFVVVLVVLLVAVVNQNQTNQNRQTQDKNSEPRCIIQGLRCFGTIGRQSRTVRGPRPNA